MKILTHNILAILASVIPVHCQLVLNPGESFSYTFDSLPFERLIVGEPGSRYGYFYLTFGQDTFGVGDSLRLDFFENDFNEAPAASAVYSEGGNPPFGVYVGLGWQDIQGAFRITQLTGSEIINRINVQVVTMNPDFSFNLYQQILTPIPEPGTAWILTAALGIGALRFIRKAPPIGHRRKADRRRPTRAFCNSLTNPMGYRFV